MHKNIMKCNKTLSNISQERAHLFATFLGCSIATLPFTYLGLPMGTTKPTVQDLMPLVDRIERRVSATFMLMSYSGRVTLINSLLTSIATFTMCSIQLNPKILEHIEKIRRHCLWVKKLEDGEEKCYSLASWQMVCRPKKKGGLGILNLKLQNEALLLKYLHKFYNKIDTSWVHLLWNTYYQGRIPHAMDPVGSFWWKDICKLMPVFRGFAVSSVNNGAMTLFGKILGLMEFCRRLILGHSHIPPLKMCLCSKSSLLVALLITSGYLSLPRLWRRSDPCKMIQQLSFMKMMTLGLTLGVGLTHPANITSSVLRKSTPMSLFFGCGNLNVHPELSSLVG
jgi:hypothetical protein